MIARVVGPLLIASWVLAAIPLVAQAAEPTISLELVTEEGFRQEDARKWFAVFEEIQIYGVRIRGGQRGDRVALDVVGEPPTRYRITGILNARNQLDLPGGRFTLNDKAGLAAWAAKIRSGGEDALFDKPAAFGLTERQLAAAKKELSPAITFSTKGESAVSLVEKLLQEITPALSLDAALQGKLQQAGKFPDELSGLSAGTALAALLRPAGLAVVPFASGQSVEWKIIDAQAAREVWPVGWKPTKAPKDYVPELFQFLSVEIEDTALTEVLEAIGGRLKVPLIVDQNSLARERVELATTKVSLPKTNTFYQKILERALFQAKLKLELRVDEADHPFLWITTIKS